MCIRDREQRFGVSHKERIKDLKRDVDVLTLTATPIPRTLEMAMTGIRDMSTIDTPPEERKEVQAYVARFDWNTCLLYTSPLHISERKAFSMMPRLKLSYREE